MTKYNQLTSDERFLIEKLYNREYSPRQISELLNRSPSTIYRELNRNKESDGYYSAGNRRLYDDRFDSISPPQGEDNGITSVYRIYRFMPRINYQNDAIYVM